MGEPKEVVSGAKPDFSRKNLFIGIIGLIGAGKSTLCKSLAEHMGLPDYYEEVSDNPYLEQFYQDMATNSFPLQVYLLNRRFCQHQVITWRGSGGVQDRTIYEDSIFAKILMQTGLMTPLDYQTYLQLFENMSKFMVRPNLIVMLDVDPEVSLERIRKRGRACEAGITIEYLHALKQGYEEFVKEISKIIPVIRVNWNEFKDAETVADHIYSVYEKIQTVHTVECE